MRGDTFSQHREQNLTLPEWQSLGGSTLYRYGESSLAPPPRTWPGASLALLLWALCRVAQDTVTPMTDVQWRLSSPQEPPALHTAVCWFRFFSFRHLETTYKFLYSVRAVPGAVAMNVSEHASDCHEMVTDRKIPCQDQSEKGQVNPSIIPPGYLVSDGPPKTCEAPAAHQHCWMLGALGSDATDTFSLGHWF